MLMFESGVSTKNSITDISGRGVGMDAVKNFIINMGGKISLIVNDLHESNQQRAPFELVITLPESLYFSTSNIKELCIPDHGQQLTG